MLILVLMWPFASTPYGISTDTLKNLSAAFVLTVEERFVMGSFRFRHEANPISPWM